MTLLIILLGIIGILSLIKTRWGLYIILLILPAYLWRIEIGFVPTTFLELAIYLVFTLWLVKSFSGRKFKLKIRRLGRLLKPFLVPICLFWLAAIGATIISPDKRLSLGVLKGWFLDPFLVFILFLDLIRQKKHLRAVIVTLFLTATWVSLFGIYEFLTGVGLDTDDRLNSVYVPANYVGMLVAPILVLGFHFLRKIESKFLKILYYLLFASILLALYLSKSYGAWLGLFAALVFLWLQVKLPRKRMKYLLIFTALATVVIFAQARSDKFGRLFEFGFRTSSSTRSEIWQTAVLIIKEHPLLGVGLGNFEAVYREYIPRVAFPPLEWLVVKPHNLYLNLWIEMGLLGLGSFIYLIVLFFRQGARSLDRPVTKYLLAAMIVLLVHGLVDTPYFKNDLSVLFWVLIAIVVFLNFRDQKNLSAARKRF